MAQDPKHAGPTPPQPEQRQEPPGRTAEMTPKPDHGEESYQGCGKLEGRAAVITGGDSGIGRAVAIAFAREGAERAGQPKELAPTFVLLASEDGSYMTGAVVPVTGGQPML